MIVDCHVHIAANSGGRGSLSPQLLHGLPFNFMRWALDIGGEDAAIERQLEPVLAGLLNDTAELDAAVVLAFDGVYAPDGSPRPQDTHFYVTNDYVIELARRYPKMRFGASVHPYRKDAIAELERCIREGAVLLKWLPPTQDIDPSDARCLAFFEVLAHYGLPLLSHTGGEQTLPIINPNVADPTLLTQALQLGVKVIAAHCGTRSRPGERDYLPEFTRLARDYEHCYGDTAALNLPTRWYAYETLLGDETLRAKLVHGSDWAIVPLPPPKQVGWVKSFELIDEPNWLRRDVLIKKALGLGDDYWQRAGQLLRISAAGPRVPGPHPPSAD